MNYLALCNLVINESGLEQNVLTESNWDSSEAGRRLYPRIKSAVARAWKKIQIDRNEWEFGTAELTQTLLPRILIDDMLGTVDVGKVYKGRDSGLELAVLNVLPYTNPLLAMGGDVSWRTVEFSAGGSYNRALLGETFDEVTPVAEDSSFVYRGRGGYKLSTFSEFAREPHWATFIASQTTYTPSPVTYIPWVNWVYKELSYTTATRSAPSFVSQDPNGELVFYPQTLSPYTVNFVCDLAPQELVEWDDTPSLKLLPAEYHEWVAWEAIESIARFDKNPDLLAHARPWTTLFRRKAERNLMPLMSWRESRYNR